MRDWAAAASMRDWAAAACRPGWAGASPRGSDVQPHRKHRTGCCPGHAEPDADRRRQDRADWCRERPAHRDDRRPASRAAAGPCWGPGAADGSRWGRRQVAGPGARRRAHAPPERCGLPLPAPPSARRRAPLRPPPRCHGRSPAWPRDRARGPDGRGPSAWGERSGPAWAPAKRARWAFRSVPGGPDGAAAQAGRWSVPGRWLRSGRWVPQRRAPRKRNRSLRGHHAVAGPPGPRRCWTRI
jgi:hypothetical protein